MVPWSDRIVGTCGLCQKSVRRRASVTVYRGTPSERVVDFPANLVPRLMLAHLDCHLRVREAKHAHKLGRALTEDERSGILEIERGLGPVEVVKGVKMAKAKTKAKPFSETYDPSEAPAPDFPPFVTSEEKSALAESGDRLKITAIRIGDSKHGAVFHVDVTSKGLSEPGTLTFSYDGKVAGRDFMLERMADWLAENDGASVPVRLVKQGRTYVLELL